METKEIIEGNKLIAKFMQLKESNGNWYRWDSINQGQGYHDELLSFILGLAYGSC